MNKPNILKLALLLCAVACSIVTGTLLAFFRSEAPSNVSQRTLAFEDRAAYQRAIEEVYWRHRIWPKERPDPKPSLDAVMSEAQLEGKVADYLRNSQALEDYWQQPVTAEQLQAEMERMASRTKQPGMLREIFVALGNDPFVIAECLARPVLAERLVTELYAHDQRFHGELKRRAEAELQTHRSVRQMNQTSGTYTEMEWIKSDAAETGSAPADAKNVQAVKMNGSEWQERVEKLAKEFGDAKAGDAWGQIKTGTLSPLQEDEGHYYAVAIMKKGKDRLKLATVAWLKEPLRSWVARAETQVPVTMAAVSANYVLPPMSSAPTGGCIDAWTATSTTSAPAARFTHTAVWTGSEMIVWGGYDGFGFSNTGGRYNPSTDSWTASNSTSAPAGRYSHTAVWTGSEMIVWGGYPDIEGSGLNTGGRYNPSTDSWTTTSTTNAPTGRGSHTAVWTNSEMAVWGGFSNGIPFFNTGARYNPSTDSWTATSTTNAPTGRSSHTAVWSDGEMIVWGGFDGVFFSNTGGRYNPSTDSWTATSTTNAPEGRIRHAAVWAGSEMIVWGGDEGFGLLNTGGLYNPSTDSWTATSTTGAPDPREQHTGVWTGNEMIVWGGLSCQFYLNTGGRYDPITNSWTATSTTNAPIARDFHTAVWTGSEMIVWGGDAGAGLNTGGRYCAAAPSPTPTPTTTPTATATATPPLLCADDSWTATSTSGAPAARDSHTAVWTGSEMIVWGGFDGIGAFFNTGGLYNPSTDSWTASSTTSAPAARAGHTAVWIDSEMIVWGGNNGGSYFNTGGRYNPGTDSWTPTSAVNAPALGRHTAVWTGSEMIVWGGTGGRYNPSTDSWTPTSLILAPTSRESHSAVWTGSEMIVWGGGIPLPPRGRYNPSITLLCDFNTGGRYNPSTDTWTVTSTTNAPAGRFAHTAVWTGSEMVVWGGHDGIGAYFDTGGRYNPSTDSWTATSTTGAPDPREQHTGVWTGSEMIVWGGDYYDGSYHNFNTGGRYNPSTDSWTAISTSGAPTARHGHTAVWRGEMIVWGGIGGTDLNTGGRYCAQSGPPPTPTPTATATPTATPRLSPTPRPRPSPRPRPTPRH